MTGTRVEIKHYLSGYQHETSRLFCHKAAKFRLRGCHVRTGPARRAGHRRQTRSRPKAACRAVLIFALLLVCGTGYAVYGILTDTSNVGEPLANERVGAAG